MTLQYRPGPDALPYAPQRDIRYVYPSILKAVCDRFNGDGWPELTGYAEGRGCTSDDLMKANLAFIEFVNHSCDNPDEQMQQVLEKVGWFGLNVEAQIAYMAMLGTVLSGQLFHSMRDTTKLGNKPDGAEDLLKQALEIVSKYGEKPNPCDAGETEGDCGSTGCCRRT